MGGWDFGPAEGSEKASPVNRQFPIDPRIPVVMLPAIGHAVGP
jgi:hypothetical protein